MGCSEFPHPSFTMRTTSFGPDQQGAGVLHTARPIQQQDNAHARTTLTRVVPHVQHTTVLPNKFRVLTYSRRALPTRREREKER
jgi:hypothetical protein